MWVELAPERPKSSGKSRTAAQTLILYTIQTDHQLFKAFDLTARLDKGI
jgi:hypothetical protein